MFHVYNLDSGTTDVIAQSVAAFLQPHTSSPSAPLVAYSMLLWYALIFFFLSFYLTSCIITAVTWLTLLLLLILSVYLWLILTWYQYTVVTQYWYLLFSDSLWLRTILWLIMSCLLIVLVTHCPSDAIVLVTLIIVMTPLFSNTISTGVFGP